MIQDSKLLGQTRYAAILDDYSALEIPPIKELDPELIRDQIKGDPADYTMSINLTPKGTLIELERKPQNRHERRRAAAESRRKS